MYMSLVLVGIVLIAIGALALLYISNVSIPYLSRHANDIVGYIPISTTITSIVFIVLGFVSLVFGIGLSKMGKYFKFY